MREDSLGGQHTIEYAHLEVRLVPGLHQPFLLANLFEVIVDEGFTPRRYTLA